MEDRNNAEKKSEGLSLLHKLMCLNSAIIAEKDLMEWNYSYNAKLGEK